MIFTSQFSRCLFAEAAKVTSVFAAISVLHTTGVALAIGSGIEWNPTLIFTAVRHHNNLFTLATKAARIIAAVSGIYATRFTRTTTWSRTATNTLAALAEGFLFFTESTGIAGILTAISGGHTQSIAITTGRRLCATESVTGCRLFFGSTLGSTNQGRSQNAKGIP